MIDLYKTRENARNKFYNDIDASNKLWYGVIHLIITLSSSFLLISLAVVDKLFPSIDKIFNLPGFLIVGWVCLFIAIVLGIIAEIDAAIFHGNLAKDSAKILEECDNKIAQGSKQDTNLKNSDNEYMVNNNVFWGAASVNFFIFAISCLCITFLKRIFPSPTFYSCFLAIMVVFFLVVMNYYLLKKRNLLSN